MSPRSSSAQRWVNPEAVLTARKSAMARFIANYASGNHPHNGPFVDTLVEGLRQAARDARALHRSHVNFTELQAEIAIEVDVVLAHMKALAALEQRIGVLYAELQPTDFLRTIPGVGQHLAPMLLEQVIPMFGREVEESQQRLGVLAQAATAGA